MARIHHHSLRLQADPGRVVIRPFHLTWPSTAASPKDADRVRRIVDAVLAMDMRTCQAELALVNRDFTERHWQTSAVFLARFEQVREQLQLRARLTNTEKELIGAYFCHEYSFAAAALMNPSIVPHPDQSGLSEGAVRFILSLRAVGEGHISSIAFREGILTPGHEMSMLPQSALAVAAELVDPYAKVNGGPAIARRNESVSLSNSVIFPMTPAQRNGLEDLRLVRFVEENGDATYYGTYTAYSGSAIASELLITKDFRTFELQPLSGKASQNKGLALFPRKIGGAYAMIGRQDGERVFFMQSDDITRWEGGAMLLEPRFPWELVQMGNCGSPIEIDEGWLLLTHGVGPMRKYSIGAALLDKQNPSKVLGRLSVPLLSPADHDREGYVPNVVYTCGALVNGRSLFLPYGIADSSVAFAWIDLDELIAEMI